MSNLPETKIEEGFRAKLPEMLEEVSKKYNRAFLLTRRERTASTGGVEIHYNYYIEGGKILRKPNLKELKDHLVSRRKKGRAYNMLYEYDTWNYERFVTSLSSPDVFEIHGKISRLLM